MDNNQHNGQMNLEVEVEKIKGELKLLSQGQEATNKSLDEIKLAFKELNNSIPALRETINQAYDKVIHLGETWAEIKSDHQLNTDFRKAATIDLAEVIKSDNENTRFRQQAEVIVRLVKWMGLPTIASIIYLYVKLLIDGKI